MALIELLATQCGDAIVSCPSVLLDDVTGYLVIRGTKTDRPDITGQTGEDEAVIEIDLDFIRLALCNLDLLDR